MIVLWIEVASALEGLTHLCLECKDDVIVKYFTQKLFRCQVTSTCQVAFYIQYVKALQDVLSCENSISVLGFAYTILIHSYVFLPSWDLFKSTNTCCYIPETDFVASYVQKYEFCTVKSSLDLEGLTHSCLELSLQSVVWISATFEIPWYAFCMVDHYYKYKYDIPVGFPLGITSPREDCRSIA